MMQTLNVEVRDGVATLTIQRPELRNALNFEMVRELLTALEQLKRSDTARAIVLTGAGSAFCSGVDLHTVDLATPKSKQGAHLAIRSLLDPVVTLLRGFRYPIIAAVNGPAVGAGMSLALAADIVIAADSAFFRPSFIDMGLVPDAGIVHHLARRVGGSRSLYALLLSTRIDPGMALEWGLVNEVVPHAQLLARAQALGSTLAAGPTRAIQSLRALHELAFNRPLSEYLAEEQLAQADSIGNDECLEGVRAFFEKRPPQFHKGK